MQTLAIYAGHGGLDPGAIGSGYMEKDLTLAVSKALTKLLRQKGYMVINNRTKDTDRSIEADADLANSSHVDAVIELHLNSSRVQSAQTAEPPSGAEAYVSINDKGTARKIGNAILEKISALGYKNRGVKTLTDAARQDVLGILRLINAPTVLVEMAFINNHADMKQFDIVKMATAIAEGIETSL